MAVNQETLMAGEPQGILIRITDPNLQVYLQKYPFASGPDPETNNHCRHAISRSIETRQAGLPGGVISLKEDEIKWSFEESSRLETMMEKVGIDGSERQILIEEYKWKVAFIPRNIKRVLVIGCGSGEELLFVHSVCPSASITAIDLRDILKPEIKKLLKVDFICGNIYDLHDNLSSSFDLIFSNHTFEHMYDPYGMLSFCAQVPSSFVAALPMDMARDAVFSKIILNFALDPAKIHPLDFIKIDAGHPWKTNETDLRTTLTAAGFTDIKLYARYDHISRTFTGGRKKFKVQKYIGYLLNRLILGTMRSVMKIIFPKAMPEMLVRLFFSFENRLWFGSNRLKNTFAPEVLIIADKLDG
jgi:SAM-dependent methyltransferase